MKTSFNVGDLIHREFNGFFWLYEVINRNPYAADSYEVCRLINTYKPATQGNTDYVDFNILDGTFTVVWKK